MQMHLLPSCFPLLLISSPFTGLIWVRIPIFQVRYFLDRFIIFKTEKLRNTIIQVFWTKIKLAHQLDKLSQVGISYYKARFKRRISYMRRIKY